MAEKDPTVWRYLE